MFVHQFGEPFEPARDHRVNPDIRAPVRIVVVGSTG